MDLTPLVTIKQETKNGIRFHATELVWNLQKLSNFPIVLCSNGIKASRECYKRTTWSVEIIFKSSSMAADCIELKATLLRTDHIDQSVDVQFHLKLEGELQNGPFESSCSSTVHTNIPIIQPSLPISMSLELNQEELFWLRNNLTVRVSFVVNGCCLVMNDTSPKDYHLSKLIQDFQRGYVEKINPDVELTCGSYTILAHRFILCSRSPLFRQELEKITKPMIHYLLNSTGKFTGAFLLFINYLYTDEINFPPAWTVLDHVFQIAKQYGVTSLQHLCGQMIVRCMDLPSVCGFLKTAHSTRDSALKDICMEFMKDNFYALRSIEPWENFKKSSPRLYSEVFRYVTGCISSPAIT